MARNKDHVPPPPPPPSDFSMADEPQRFEARSHIPELPPPPPTEDNATPPPPPAAPVNEALLGSGPVRKFNSSKRKHPPSIEEILKEKEAADAAAKKPRFIPRAERERLRKEKEDNERAERERQAAKAYQEKMEWINGASKTSNGSAPAPTGPRAERSSDVPAGPAAMRKGKSNGTDSKLNDPDAKKNQTAEEIAAAMTRERYMGTEITSQFSAQKKRKRTTERKFNFSWNPEEDTTGKEINPLYEAPPELRYLGRRLGNLTDEACEKKLMEAARNIERTDPITGAARAKQLIENDRRRRAHLNRHAIDSHWTEKSLDQMRERDWRIFKEDFNISAKGGGIPNPMRNWAESGLPPQLLRIVEEVGYSDPSPVQRAAIPIALQNRDVIAVAATGSGKTAAYLLPLIVYISQLGPSEMSRVASPLAIILAPTRELAQQIEVEAKKFGNPLGFNTVSIVGGHSIESQSQAMSGNVDILVGTVGRLVDCLERRVLVLEQCCYVIFDEADRMVDMGFEEPVNKILDYLPVGTTKPDTEEAERSQSMSIAAGRYRQTMMYTATMPPAVERIARNYLRRPAIVNIGQSGEAVETVQQIVEFIGSEDKRKARMFELLSQPAQYPPPIIVFCNIKAVCTNIARDIQRAGFSSASLHGGKTQQERETAIESLRTGKVNILVATDVAARGIDISDVSLVIQYDMATNIEQYTHRIGRTGRAGKQGTAITFVSEGDKDVFYDLKQILTKSQISKVPEELKKHEAAQQRRNAVRKIE